MDARDKKRLVRGTVLNFAGGLGQALRPVFFFVGTWLMGADTLGLFALALAPLEVLAFLVGSGLADAVQRNAARDPDRDLAPDERRRIHGLVATALLWACVVSLVAAALVVALGGVLAERAWQRPGAYPVLLVLAASLPLTGVTAVLLAGVRALMFMGADLAVRSIAVPVTLLSGVFAAHLIAPSALGLAAVWTLAQGAGAVAAAVAFARHYSLRLLWQERPGRAGSRHGHGRPLLGFAVPQSLNMTLTQATWNLDLIMLGALAPGLGDAALGIYRIGSEIARQVFSLRTSFASVYASLVARYSLERDTGAIQSSFARVSRWIVLLAAPVTALLIWYRDAIIRLFEPGFAAGGASGSGDFMILLLAGSLVACAVGLSGNILVMSGFARFNLLNSAILTAVNAGLNIALIPRLGLTGAALATMVATAGIQVLQVVELRWLLGITAEVRPLLAPLGAAALGLLAAWSAAHLGVSHALAGAVFVPVYALAVLLRLRATRARPGPA